jgi:hypothetical protein
MGMYTIAKANVPSVVDYLAALLYTVDKNGRMRLRAPGRQNAGRIHDVVDAPSRCPKGKPAGTTVDCIRTQGQG